MVFYSRCIDIILPSIFNSFDAISAFSIGFNGEMSISAASGYASPDMTTYFDSVTTILCRWSVETCHSSIAVEEFVEKMNLACEYAFED